ncbi:hypothetical protein [Kribbella sp. NBC_00889]|uniref:hypothetical protein n=1 Tax=Kribbella sp. NBC_00889 TaxID=2975974 RepID=UPI0038643F91|nr:hypothetical protein OG817_39490 [Kribbella sp. NBC_00889]
MHTALPPDFALTAWVDESVIVGRTGSDGAYTMAAAVADLAACPEVRDRLRALTLGRTGRLHWANESPKRRDAVTAFIASLDLAAVVVVGSPMLGPKQERARRCCLERLLHELAVFGVGDVWMESRSAVPDRRDIRLIDSARRKGLVPDSLVVRFARPKDDPMLWIPDAIAGAVTAATLGEPRWVLPLEEILTRHDVVVR